MRLVEKTVKANPDTFAPELLVTVALPLTVEIDSTATQKSLDEWGREFLDIIRARHEPTNS